MKSEMLNISPEKFALACVQSSPTQYSVKQKMDVYKEAFAMAKKIVENNNKIQKQKDKEESEATRKAVENFFS